MQIECPQNPSPVTELQSTTIHLNYPAYDLTESQYSIFVIFFKLLLKFISKYIRTQVLVFIFQKQYESKT